MDAKIFIDMNLRSPWWDTNKIQQLSRVADWVKLNQDELQQISMGDNDNYRIMNYFTDNENIKELILTRGEQGALTITPEGQFHEIAPEVSENFVDTVGAGDAFSSVILLGKYYSWPTEITMKRAQEFASAVVGLRGATTLDKDFYQGFVEKWEI